MPEVERKCLPMIDLVILLILAETAHAIHATKLPPPAH